MKETKVYDFMPKTPTLLVRKKIFRLSVALWCVIIFAVPFALSKEAQRLNGHPIPGVSFRIFLESGKSEGGKFDQALGRAALDTIVQAFTKLVQHRSQYKRFDQAVTKNMLERVVIEPRVLNRDGKEFPFLVAKTKHKGKVKLLINASRLEQDGYLNHSDALALRLAKEFQWVISKASTKPKRKGGWFTRDSKNALISTNSEIQKMSQVERTESLQALLENYIQTVDAYGSLINQPYYEIGTTTLVGPTQSDSTAKRYDILVREALQLIVKDSYFWKNTPKAVRSLLNGKVWQVMMAKIDDRDWTTRTRIVPKDNAVKVGVKEKLIQPAKILVNYHRAMEPEENLYVEMNGLPMGALSIQQLARVIAWEIQTQITEKSLRGHVAQDEESDPNR